MSKIQRAPQRLLRMVLAKLQLPLGHDLAGIYTHVGQRRVKNGKAWTKVPS